MKQYGIDWTGCKWVEQVPGRRDGVPVVAGSRVTPETIVENFDDGVSSVGQVAWMFSLPRAKVLGVLEFADRSVAGRLTKAA